jgi:DUF177 domain-containing protein
MKLNLWGFLEGSEDILRFQGQLEYGSLNLSDRDVEIIEPIEYKGEIFKADGDKVIHLDVQYTYSERCSRCLQPSTDKIKTSLYGKLLEGRNDLKDEDDGYEEILFYENGVLILDEYILEQVIVSLPIKTLCKDDCKGLCSKCGRDLNKEKCDCVHEDIDPRLEKLKDFFSKY